MLHKYNIMNHNHTCFYQSVASFKRPPSAQDVNFSAIHINSLSLFKAFDQNVKKL